MLTTIVVGWISLNLLVRNRVDQEAEAMAQPADPYLVLDAIKETHAKAEQIRGSADGS